MELPVDPTSTAQSKRRTLLRLGDRLGWWKYESENQPGHVDRRGYEYPTVTYTIVLPGDGAAADRERVLLPDEVIGYVLRAAEERGDVGMVAYREGLSG
ncbi:hypothetical protein ACIBTV_27540 [Micromonospora sp. NPDC049366]|uniref:hypothetical protein n=1 Tax=Micromonospora sp. NPDC049366 TaxID=3364271 RepID=UPI00379F9490